MNNRIKYLFVSIAVCIAIVFCSTYNLVAQSNNVSDSTFTELKEGLDFTKTKTILVPRHEFEEIEEKEDLEETTNLFSSLGLGALFKLIAYGLIIALIVYILYLVYSNIKIEEKVEVDSELHFDFEDIEEIDPDKGLKDALASGDFRLAIRMKFIKVLQILVKKGSIHWTPEKTNRDYRREIKESDEQRRFGEMALIYENVWFGNFPINGEDYMEYSPLFDHYTKDDKV